jgi:hypothetical protein
LNDRRAETLRMMIAIFERKVRQGAVAKCAVTKAQQANIDFQEIEIKYCNVNLWFLIAEFYQLSGQDDAAIRSQYLQGAADVFFAAKAALTLWLCE